MERPDLLWSLSQPVSETLRRTLCLQGAALGPHPLVPDDRLDQFAQLVCIDCNTFLGWVDCAGERHAAPHIPPSRRPPAAAAKLWQPWTQPRRYADGPKRRNQTMAPPWNCSGPADSRHEEGAGQVHFIYPHWAGTRPSAHLALLLAFFSVFLYGCMFGFSYV